MKPTRYPRLLLVPVVLLAIAAAGAAQEGAGRPVAPDAEPYQEEEFPGWAVSLRRAEVVAFGTLPISLLASRLLYGIGRFAVASIGGGGFDVAYLPPIVAPPGAVPFSRTDNLRIVLGAVTLSTAIAIVDYSLGRGEPAEAP